MTVTHASPDVLGQTGDPAAGPAGSLSPRTAPLGRLGSLDAVRAIACAMVIVSHVSLYRGDGSLHGLRNGVMLFFALSGYLLFRPFLRGAVDLGAYAMHRAARIPACLFRRSCGNHVAADG